MGLLKLIDADVRPVDKEPLEREALRDVIDLALWAGQLLLQHGAETDRIEETVHRIGTGLGANWMDILVSPNAVVCTTSSGEEFRTKVRRVVALGVNMTILAEINDLSRKVSQGQLNRFQVRRELERIGQIRSNYSRWLVAVCVGLACSAFSQLFGGDWGAFILTAAASSFAMIVRQQMQLLYFNPFVTTIVTAFSAAAVVSVGMVLDVTATPERAMASAVLLLVPGVHLINAAEDILKGHMVTGLVRGMLGALLSMAIAIGLVLAMMLFNTWVRF